MRIVLRELLGGDLSLVGGIARGGELCGSSSAQAGEVFSAATKLPTLNANAINEVNKCFQIFNFP